MLMEMCINQHVRTKNVITIQPTKVVISKSVKTCLIFLLRSKNRKLCCLVVMVHIALQKRRIATTKKMSYLHVWCNLSANHSAHPKKENFGQKRKNHLFYGIILSTPLWLIKSTKTSFLSYFYTLPVGSKGAGHSQIRKTVVSSLLTLDQIEFLWL